MFVCVCTLAYICISEYVVRHDQIFHSPQIIIVDLTALKIFLHSRRIKLGLIFAVPCYLIGALGEQNLTHGAIIFPEKLMQICVQNTPSNSCRDGWELQIELTSGQFQLFCQTIFKLHKVLFMTYHSAHLHLWDFSVLWGIPRKIHLSRLVTAPPLLPPVTTSSPRLQCPSGRLLSVVIGLMRDRVNIPGKWNPHTHTHILQGIRHWAGQVM